jgi:hypothetical protein
MDMGRISLARLLRDTFSQVVEHQKYLGDIYQNDN